MGMQFSSDLLWLMFLKFFLLWAFLPVIILGYGVVTGFMMSTGCIDRMECKKLIIVVIHFVI